MSTQSSSSFEPSTRRYVRRRIRGGASSIRPRKDSRSPQDDAHARVDDAHARAEHAELVSNLRSGVTVLWDAFKTYFTVIALLFTASALFLSKQSIFTPSWSVGICLAISIGGIAITALALKGVERIICYQRLFLARGLALERGRRVRSRVLGTSRRAWRHTKWFGSDQLTALVLGGFGLMWAALAAYCVLCFMGRVPYPNGGDHEAVSQKLSCVVADD